MSQSSGSQGQTAGEAITDKVTNQVIEYLLKKGYKKTEQMLRYAMIMSIRAPSKN